MQSTVAFIGENLKRARLRRMMNQRELARVAGVSPTTVANLETNRREVRPMTLRKLVKALDVTPGDLLD